MSFALMRNKDEYFSLSTRCYASDPMANSNIAYPSSYNHFSGVQDLKPPERQPSYVAITLDDTHPEVEDFDHIDELIMYLVSFLRYLRRSRSHSESDTETL